MIMVRKKEKKCGLKTFILDILKMDQLKNSFDTFKQKKSFFAEKSIKNLFNL